MPRIADGKASLDQFRGENSRVFASGPRLRLDRPHVLDAKVPELSSAKSILPRLREKENKLIGPARAIADVGLRDCIFSSPDD